MMVYHYFARHRGWTPRQVDELEIGELEWLALLDEAFGIAEERIRRQNNLGK